MLALGSCFREFSFDLFEKIKYFGADLLLSLIHIFPLGKRVVGVVRHRDLSVVDAIYETGGRR